MRIDPANMNKSATSPISSLSGVLAADEIGATISEETKCPKGLNGIINRIRLALLDAREILLWFAAFVIVLYLIGAIALGLALLYYTFTR